MTFNDLLPQCGSISVVYLDGNTNQHFKLVLSYLSLLFITTTFFFDCFYTIVFKLLIFLDHMFWLIYYVGALLRTASCDSFHLFHFFYFLFGVIKIAVSESKKTNFNIKILSGVCMCE